MADANTGTDARTEDDDKPADRPLPEGNPLHESASADSDTSDDTSDDTPDDTPDDTSDDASDDSPSDSGASDDSDRVEEEVPGAGKQFKSASADDSDDSGSSDGASDSDASDGDASDGDASDGDASTTAAEKAKEAGYEAPDFSNTPIEDVPEPEKPDVPSYGEDDEQGYVDREAADFDPDDGLYTGTAVDGGATEIPDDPTEEQKQAALDDIKAGGSGIVSDEHDTDEHDTEDATSDKDAEAGGDADQDADTTKNESD